jgi:hypothetical protein
MRLFPDCPHMAVRRQAPGCRFAEMRLRRATSGRALGRLPHLEHPTPFLTILSGPCSAFSVAPLAAYRPNHPAFVLIESTIRAIPVLCVGCGAGLADAQEVCAKREQI